MTIWRESCWISRVRQTLLHRKLGRTFAVLISTLVTVWGLSARAEDCADVLLNKPPASVETWAAQFAGLRAKILAHKDAEVFLTLNERHLLLDPVERKLSEAVRGVVPKINRLDPAFLKELNILPLYESLEWKLRAALHGARSSVTYREVTELTGEAVLFGDRLVKMNAGLGSRMSARAKSRFRNDWLMNRTSGEERLLELNWLSLRELVVEGLLAVPTDREFTIREFNYLLGQGLAPLGLIAQKLKADGRSMGPLTFYFHDIAHAMATTANARAAAFPWEEILTRVGNWPPADQALAHAVIFFFTHEFIAKPEDQFWFSETLRELLIGRLQKEDFWGEKLLRHEDLAKRLPEISWRIRETAHHQ